MLVPFQKGLLQTGYNPASPLPPDDICYFFFPAFWSIPKYTWAWPKNFAKGILFLSRGMKAACFNTSLEILKQLKMKKIVDYYYALQKWDLQV